MSISIFMFYFFIATAVLTSALLLFTKNVLHGALLLIVTLLSLAGIYVLALAEFIAVTQVLIYAGGILVVIIFAIMLTARLSDKPLQVAHGNVFSGVLAGGVMFLILAYLISGEPAFHNLPSSQPTSINTIGINLMTDYVLPFEVAGIVLLVALVGAAVFASTTPSKSS